MSAKAARKPAQVVTCPHCSWEGSARGLFSHSRLAHPTLPPPKTRGTRVWGTINANQVNSEIYNFLEVAETWLWQQLPNEEKELYNLKTKLPSEIQAKVKRLKSDDILLLLNYVKSESVKKIVNGYRDGSTK